ncbi:leucine-rich repeat neuronal protein 3 [Chiloscyllium plagiosum]|uniref:leucine-rich repeat neuronal protein 3 n=1 Tax=Chiloscyllium plagiosum TaxID=36176 RepID=UPI001CB86F18|nr:leucine-rich repeat neuronal protein 3 [Chiloscyllium plagiosum]XP_043565446.1 leucine-rich repeat neuronal protein 3 [Chiloscyllium plagiosum]XP_043565447.1 leucine-rich repeat neuronal protein 3 [Chiloscyllium plagiosum]
MMKDTSLNACVFIGLAITALVQTVGRNMDCPKSCICEIRPWFTPRSIYMEAPTIECNDLNLASLPPKIPAETQVLLLQSNNISKIENKIDYLVNLTEIDLSQNNFLSIRDINLGKMLQLMSLHLEENKLTELPDNCLLGLSNLQELYVNHNQISRIAMGAFIGLNTLLRLHLNSNLLTTVKSNWFEAIPSLEILTIGENPITKIQEMSFKPLINLRSLVLAGIKLSELGDNTLVGLNNLESISFYDNRLITVPHAALQKVPNLKFLDLNKNPIQRIRQGDFRNMLHLKELGINNMAELVSIDCLALDNLPELTKIEATNNPKLSYIHPNAFYRAPQLETLMLNSNALSALYRGTVESLPKLQEVSIHSNPIRCDCVIRWINMNKTHIRFMEPQSLFCFDPPEFKGQHVREIPFREMTDMCLPLIASGSFPSALNVSSGSSVSLHCRATGLPEPEIYWITPSGDKLLPNTATNKYNMQLEGTLDLFHISNNETGLYTCVAHNLVGADLKTVLITVNGSLAQSMNESLNIKIQNVASYSILVSWKAVSNCMSSNIQWSAKTNSDSPQLTYTARVPIDIRTYNLTHLNPSTEYEVCVHVTNLHQQTEKKCTNVTTNGLDFAVKSNGQTTTSALVAVLGAMFGVISMTCLCSYVTWRMKYNSGHSCSGKYMPSQAIFPSNNFYPPIINIWDTAKEKKGPLEVKATVIDVSATCS